MNVFLIHVTHTRNMRNERFAMIQKTRKLTFDDFISLTAIPVNVEVVQNGGQVDFKYDLAGGIPAFQGNYRKNEWFSFLCKWFVDFILH